MADCRHCKNHDECERTGKLIFDIDEICELVYRQNIENHCSKFLIKDFRCDTCKANKVCDHYLYGFENCNNYISEDVVEIVRCKDCVFAKNNYLAHGLCLCEKTIHDAIKGEIPRNTLMTEDDFCSYGERKENK